MRVYGSVAATGDTQAPTVPGGLTASAVSKSQVNLSWTASTDNVGVSGYQIFRDGSPLTTVAAPTTSYSDTTVSPSTLYTYSVAAYDAAGNTSAQSGNASVTTPANAAPTWSTIPDQTLIVGNAFNLNLATYASDADSDTLAYSLVSGTLPSGTSLSGSIISGTPTTPGESSTITVRVTDGLANADTSFATATYDADVTAPPVPSGLSASAISASEVDLSWNASTDAAGSANEYVSGTALYKLYRDSGLVVTQAGISYSDAGLTPSTSYSYQVSAVDAAGNESLKSATISATTQSSQSSSAPVLLYTDIVSGTPINGENGEGIYLSLFGLNFGSAADLGTSAGARVYIGGAEVARYMTHGDAVTTAANKPGFPAIKRIQVQIGSAAVKALTYGTAYPISVVVNGQSSNPTDVMGSALEFTPNPGHIYFVSASGNDATGVADDPTHPYRYYQTTSGGIFAVIQPGDAIVGMDEVGGVAYTDQVGVDNYTLRFERNTVKPSAPTGASGTGYVSVMAYPGHDVYLVAPAGGRTIFGGASTAYTRPNDTWGQYWTVSNFRLDCEGSLATTDSAPINRQNSADHVRCINNNIQWNSTNTNLLNAGISGNGEYGRLCGNWIHEIHGSPTNKEQHGIYEDGSNTAAHYEEIDFNVIDVTDGMNLHFHAPGALTDQFHDNNVHHCWLENAGKDAIKWDHPGLNNRMWNIYAAKSFNEAIRVDSQYQSSTVDLIAENMTIVDCHTSPGPKAVIDNESDSTLNPPGFQLINSILFFSAGTASYSAPWTRYTSGMTLSNNVYYDASGRLTSKYSGDVDGIYASPGFVNASAPPNTDPRLSAGSVAVARAINATINPSNDLGMNPQPRAGQSVRSVGAFA